MGELLERVPETQPASHERRGTDPDESSRTRSVDSPVMFGPYIGANNLRDSTKGPGILAKRSS